MILREAPNVARNDQLKSDFEKDITQMLEVHERVATEGYLVDPGYDFVLLAAVNYRENRMRLPAPDGDCGFSHKYSKVPSGLWPDGYKPVIKTVCNSVGPMQVGRGTIYNFKAWEELRAELPAKMSEKDLREPTTNVVAAYGILRHWKNTCLDSGNKFAPVSVWLAAYRSGKCPHINKGHGYYIDAEAKLRCTIANNWAKALNSSSDVVYTGATDVPCTYKERAAANQ
jgi:hypothetical protein